MPFTLCKLLFRDDLLFMAEAQADATCEASPSTVLTRVAPTRQGTRDRVLYASIAV